MKRYLDGLDDAAAASGRSASPRVLAALAPRMLQLAGARAAGTLTYFVPPEHTSFARAQLGPGALLAVELAVVLEAEPSAARARAREHTRTYLALENYRANLTRLGYRPEDLAGGGSDRLVDRIVAWGDLDTIVERVNEHLEAGADHVAIQPLGTLEDAGEALEPLAEALALDPSPASASSGFASKTA
jgi:probable F420-dependent oxidoreductase